MSGKHRLLGALWSLTLVVVVLAGIPAVLWAVGGNPTSPDTWAELTDGWDTALSPSITPTAVARAVSAVCWLAWLLLAFAVLAELSNALRGRGRARRVRGLAVFQGLAATIVAPLVLILSTLPAAARPSAPMRPAPPAAAAVVQSSIVTRAAAQPAAPASAADGFFRVRPGDTLDRIAEELCGDPLRWRDMWSSNRDMVMNDGSVFVDATRLRTGWDLRIPANMTPAGPTTITSPAPAGKPAATVEPATPVLEQPAVTPAVEHSVAAGETMSSTANYALVGRGDTLGRIAQRVYGDATRWPTIWEANRDRDMGDGRVLSDPDQIDVGWQLAIPSLPGAPATDSPTIHTVQPGDTLWDIAESAYGREDPALVTMVFEANEGVADPGGRTLHDADLINPGMRLTLPPDPAIAVAPPLAEAASPEAAAPVAPSPPPAELNPIPAPAPPAPPPPSAWPAPDAPAPQPAPDPPATAAPAPAPAAPAAPSTSSPPLQVEALRRGPRLSVASATLLATGALTIIDARRRRRLQRMGPRDVLPVPDPDLIPVDAALRAGADAPGIARLDIALRALAAAVRRDPAGTPGAAGAADPADTGVRPELVVRHRSGRIEVHLHRVPDAAPPAPWIADGPKLWSLPPSVPTAELTDAADGVPAPCPALVLLGRAGSTEIYLDLEAAGILRLDGPPDHAMALARGVLAGLAVSPLADVVRIVSTGVDAYGFANETRVETADGPADALGRAEAAAATVQATLTAEAITDTFALRAVARHESWEPTLVLLLQSALTPDQIATLAGLTGEGGRGLAVVTDQPVATSRWHLSVVDGRRWRLDPVGLVLEPVRLAADELADLGALLQDARAEPVAMPPVGPEPSDSPAPVSVLDDDPGEPYCEPEWRLQVRVMGPVDVVNGDGKIGSFEKGKALELVVWLAQHRRAPSRAAARTAMWETNVADTSFNNIVSDARRTLARLADTPDGDEWIGRTNSDRLPLHPLVVTDAELIDGRLRHARNQPDVPAIEILRDALELVRDAPYAGTGYLWPDGEGLPSNLILLVISTATEMAQRCLRVGDIEGVFWSTSRGLRILPGHDELVCLRMQAHGANGDLAGVRKEYESYERVIVNDRWGDATPSAKVVALRNQLLRGGSAP